jgi:hypothetical protein
MPAIGRCISFDRKNTNRDTSAAIMTTSMTARGTEMTIAIMDMAITIAATTAVMTMTTTTAATSADAMPTDPPGAGPIQAARDGMLALVAIAGLSLAPVVVSHAAEDRPETVSRSNAFGDAVKRDTKAAGAAIKEGAHRVATASKAVAHEIATAAKRGAAQGRAALRGQKADPPAT